MVKEWEAANPADHRPQFAGEAEELNGVDSRSTATSKSLLFVHQLATRSSHEIWR